MAAGVPKVAVLIAAGGSGTRMGAGRNKVLLALDGQPVIVHAARVFQDFPAVQRIGIIIRPGDEAAMDAVFPPGPGRAKLLPWIAGGAERRDSVYNGLTALAADPPDRVLIHDGARPFCSALVIRRVLAALDTAPAAVPVLPITDTVRRQTGGMTEVVPRTGLVRTQTPQGFAWELLWDAYRRGRSRDLVATDDAQLVEAMGVPVVFVRGAQANIKITTPEDLEGESPPARRST